MHQAKTDSIMRTSHPAAWVAAIAAMAIATVASGSCFFSSATNVCENGRRCNPGQTCALNEDVCIEIGGCGDGIVSSDPEKGEVCDDGNVTDGDGCSANCKSDETCGNGTTDTIDSENPKETCDDGNKIAGDSCSPQCFLELCGNMTTDPGEVCDDGNTMAGDGCSSDCTSNEACGNKVTDNELGTLFQEDCDPQNLFPLPAQNTETCDSDCTFPMCSDGHFNPVYQFTDESGLLRNEECDMGTDSPSCDIDCTFVVCGDNHINTAAKEECDEGVDNSNQPDASCRTDCRNRFCGDGITDLQHSEICDTELKDTANCDARDCTEVQCGDGYINMATEQCDEPGGKDTAMCNGDNAGAKKCQLSMCGDGYINKNPEVPEECESDTDCNMNESCDDCRCIL